MKVYNIYKSLGDALAATRLWPEDAKLKVVRIQDVWLVISYE